MDERLTKAPLPLCFTAEDADDAFDEWGANCGPGAIAAILGMSLAELRPWMGDFEQKHYTNPTLMWDVLGRLGIRYRLSRDKVDGYCRSWPAYGLARIQWMGPWTEPGVPARAAYRHTHWVGVHWPDAKQAPAIFDINLIESGGWASVGDWAGILVPWLLKECEPKANGCWAITHSVEITADDIRGPRRPCYQGAFPHEDQ